MSSSYFIITIQCLNGKINLNHIAKIVVADQNSEIVSKKPNQTPQPTLSPCFHPLTFPLPP
jgi:hypothetical protein